MSYASILEQTKPLREALRSHPVAATLNNIDALRHFMSHHVFAVWDFMSLVKFLQNELAGTSVPWTPPSHPELARFINEIVLGEESDEIEPGQFLSHFEYYLLAMKDVGASPSLLFDFLQSVHDQKSVLAVLKSKPNWLPDSVQIFLSLTFEILERGRPHEVAAAFCIGREDILPHLFEDMILAFAETNPTEMLRFKKYLQRHIQIDGEQHGPMSRKLLESLCADDPMRWLQAQNVAIQVLQARLNLWDGIK